MSVQGKDLETHLERNQEGVQLEKQQRHQERHLLAHQVIPRNIHQETHLLEYQDIHQDMQHHRYQDIISTEIETNINENVQYFGQDIGPVKVISLWRLTGKIFSDIFHYYVLVL